MNKNYHDVGRGRKAVQHGQRQAIGPMSNPRHPKKYLPITKKAAPSATNTEDGKQTTQDH